MALSKAEYARLTSEIQDARDAAEKLLDDLLYGRADVSDRDEAWKIATTARELHTSCDSVVRRAA